MIAVMYGISSDNQEIHTELHEFIRGSIYVLRDQSDTEPGSATSDDAPYTHDCTVLN